MDSVDVKKKKILILGGGAKQLPLMQAAKDEGYYIVLCDRSTSCLGAPLADKQYLYSITDTEAVLDIAQKEQVAGIISNGHYSLSSMGEATTKLNMVGTSRASVEKMGSKYGLREVLKDLEFFTPQALEDADIDRFCERVRKNIKFPIIIKPSMSCGSQGVKVIPEYDEEVLREAFSKAKPFSIDNRVTAENFIEAKEHSFFEGEIFVIDGKAYDFGMFNCLRSIKFPVYPATNVYPSFLTAEQYSSVMEQLTAIFKEVGFKFGIVNMEGMITKAGEIFFIELNPRQGGGANSELVKDISGVDLFRLLATTSMGEKHYYNEIKDIKPGDKFLTTLSVFAQKDGCFKGIHIDEDLQAYVYGRHDFCKPGTMVVKAPSSAHRMGIVKLSFPTREAQLACLFDLEDRIYAEIE